MALSEFDDECMQAAIVQADEAGKNQNLPIGAVISLDHQIIAVGRNTIWKPAISLHRHAETEALTNVPAELIKRANEMTLYTTLEPCMMCLGAILLYGIGRVVFGSADPYGGAVTITGNLPRFFSERSAAVEWIGPAYPNECDRLYQQVIRLENLPGQSVNLQK